MPWRGRNATHCKRCGRHRDEVGRMSARYLCDECGVGPMLENRRELIAHDGNRFRHWRRRTAAALGAILVDDVE